MQSDVFQPGTFASIPKALLAIPSKQLSASSKLVWIAIVERFGENGHAWPGATQIAKDTGLTRRAVQLAIKELSGLRLLTVSAPKEDADHNSNEYRLTDCASAISSLAQIVRQGGANGSPPTSANSSRGVAKYLRPNNLITNNPKITTEGTSAAAPLGPAALTPVGVSSGFTVGNEGGLPSAGKPSAPKAEQSAPPKCTPQSKASASAAKRQPLDDDAKAAICASPEAMRGYYWFGRETIGHPPSEWPALGLAASQTHWSPTRGDPGRPEPQVSHAAFAAWAWLQICEARHRAGLSIAMPGMPKLIGVLKSLRERRTHDNAIALVQAVTARWSEIQSSLGNWGSSLVPDEGSLAVPQVLAAADRLIAGQSLETRNNLTNKPSAEQERRYGHLF